MHLSIDCVPCLLRQAVLSSRIADLPPDQEEYFIKEILTIVSNYDFSQSPPIIGGIIHRRIRQLTSCHDPYKKIKTTNINYAKKILPQLESTVSSSNDPFVTALKISLAGNIIDYGAREKVNISKVTDEIQRVLKAELAEDIVSELRNDIKTAGKILYIGDNAGEAVFDTLLLKRLPLENITYAVRGSAVINDVTTDDAQRAGVSELVRVIDSGSDIPGLSLDECSDYFRKEYFSSDLIISKGQGNFETLCERKENIYFLLKVKCDHVAKLLETKKGNWIIHRSAIKRSVKS